MKTTERDNWFLMEADEYGIEAGRYVQFQNVGEFLAVSTGHRDETPCSVWMEPDEAILFGEKLIAAAKAVNSWKD